MTKNQIIFEEIKKRSANMYLTNQPPSPRWWLERIAEILELEPTTTIK